MTKFNNPCDEGFVCELGTGEMNKNQVRCPKAMFCPTGTTFTEVFTKCPKGTGPDSTTGLVKLPDCIPLLDNLIISSSDYNYFVKKLNI